MIQLSKMYGVEWVRKGIAAGALLAATAGVPTAAFARHPEFRLDIDVPVAVEDHQDRCEVRRVWVEPVYRTVCDRQWVEPTYQTVTERVWIAPTESSRTERVYVPEQYGYRDVVRCDEWGRRRVCREQVLICAAHYEDRQVGCVEIPGHYQDVTRQQIVCDGHWQRCERQQLVCAGHWETRGAPVYVESRGGARLEFRLPF